MPEIEIKDDPKLKSILRKITEAGFTGLVWGIWAYLLLPIINIIMWLLGFKYFHFSVIEQLGYVELQGMLVKMGWTVLVVFIILRVWGYYNYYRFGRRNQRSGVPKLTVEKLAEHYNVPVEEVRELQLKKEVVWGHFSNKGI